MKFTIWLFSQKKRKKTTCRNWIQDHLPELACRRDSPIQCREWYQIFMKAGYEHIISLRWCLKLHKLSACLQRHRGAHAAHRPQRILPHPELMVQFNGCKWLACSFSVYVRNYLSLHITSLWNLWCFPKLLFKSKTLSWAIKKLEIIQDHIFKDQLWYMWEIFLFG